MGIEIPESYGGGGATLLPLRARGRGAVARRPVDRRARRRAEHARHQRAAALGQRRASSSATCRSWRRAPIGAYALSEAGSGSDAFALTTRARRTRRRLGAHRPQALDHQRATRPTSSSSSRTSNPDGGLPRHHRVPRRARLRRLHGRQEGRQARHPRQQHLRAAARGLPRAARQRARRGRQGLQGRDRDAERRAASASARR